MKQEIIDALIKCSFRAKLQKDDEFKRGYMAAIHDIEKLLELKK